MPSSTAASMIAKACSRDSPCPKSSGAEPIPPKFPQPRMMRETSMPLPPRRRLLGDALTLSSRPHRESANEPQGRADDDGDHDPSEDALPQDCVDERDQDDGRDRHGSRLVE